MQGIRKELTGYMKKERNKGNHLRWYLIIYLLTIKRFVYQNGSFKELSEEKGDPALNRTHAVRALKITLQEFT